MRIVLLSFIGFLVAFAPLPYSRKGPEQTILQALQGRWTILSTLIEGKPQLRSPQELDISGNRITYYLDGEPTSQWVFKLAEVGRAGRFLMHGVNDRKGEIAHGIVQFKKDSCTMCYRYAVDGPAPAAFVKRGKAIWLETLRRKKP